MQTEQELDASIQALRAELPTALLEPIDNFILLLALDKANSYYATAILRSAYVRGQIDGVREVKALLIEQEPQA